MKDTDRVHASISSQRMKALFKSSANKMLPAFWGLAGCLSKDKSKSIGRLYAAGQNASGSFKIADENLKQILVRVDALVVSIEDEKSTTISLADAVETLALTQILAATEKLDQPAAGALANVGQKLRSLAAAAMQADLICELQTKSIGLEVELVLAGTRNDSKVDLKLGLLEEFESIIESNLDADGWPDARLLTQIGALAGCWSRITMMFKALELDLDGNVQIQLEWLVRQCMRLMRADGSLSFGENSVLGDGAEQVVSFDKAYWQSVASMSVDPDDAVVFQMLMAQIGGKKSSSKKSKTSKLTPLMANELVEPFNISEWASSFLIRSSWNPKSPRVAVDFSYRDSQPSGRGPVAEQCFAQVSRTVSLIHGQTLPEIIVDDQAVQLASSFEVVCERHDEEVDYVEIQAELSNGGSLNRQWLLARNEEFLLVTDYVLPSPAAKIEYRCRWPLAAGITTLEESETREVYLQTDGSADQKQKINALVLPLALPEWRADRCSGRLVAGADELVLEQQFAGDALYAPLLFDLNPKRSLKKRTWRKLTVAQDRQIVTDDQAMAFRFQLNKRQWFFYRALASMGNRTFLGENVSSEFAFNRLHKSGKVSSLFEVE